MAILQKVKSAVVKAVKNVVVGATIPGQIYQGVKVATGKITPKEAIKTTISGITTATVVALPVAKVGLLGKGAQAVVSSSKLIKGGSIASKVVSGGKILKQAVTSKLGKTLIAGAVIGGATGLAVKSLSKATPSGAVGDQKMGLIEAGRSFVGKHPVLAGVGAGIAGAGLAYGASKLYKKVKADGTPIRGRRGTSILTKRGMKLLRKLKTIKKQLKKANRVAGIKTGISQSKPSFFKSRRK